MITLQKLKDKNACEGGIILFKELFGEQAYISEIIKRYDIPPEYIAWLIINFKEARTPEMIEYFKEIEPDPYQIVLVMVNVKEYRTAEMFELVNTLGMFPNEVALLIKGIKEYQNIGMVKYFKSLDPDEYEIRSLIQECVYCQRPEIKKILLEGIEEV